MGKRIDEQTRNTIVRLLFHRCRQSEIAKELDVSLPVVKKIERNLLDHGIPTKPDVKYHGRPPTMKPEIVEALLTKFERTGFDFGQKELRQWLKERYDVDVSQSTISRIITKSGRKKAIAVLAENRKLAENAEDSAEHAGLVWIGGPPGSDDMSPVMRDGTPHTSSSSHRDVSPSSDIQRRRTQEHNFDPSLRNS